MCIVSSGICFIVRAKGSCYDVMMFILYARLVPFFYLICRYCDCYHTISTVCFVSKVHRTPLWAAVG